MSDKKIEIDVSKVEPLTDKETAQMDSQRAWVAGYPGFFGDLNTVDGKLLLIETILKDEKALAGGPLMLQTLGVVLGDAVAQAKGMRWYMLEANIGRGPCIGVPGTSVKVLPVLSIGNELALNKTVDVRGLFDFFCRSVDELKAQYAMLK